MSPDTDGEILPQASGALVGFSTFISPSGGQFRLLSPPGLEIVFEKAWAGSISSRARFRDPWLALFEVAMEQNRYALFSINRLTGELTALPALLDGKPGHTTAAVDIDAHGNTAIADVEKLVYRKRTGELRTLVTWGKDDPYLGEVELHGDEVLYAATLEQPDTTYRTRIALVDVRTGAETIVGSDPLFSHEIVSGAHVNDRYVTWSTKVAGSQFYDRTSAVADTAPFTAMALSGDWICGEGGLYNVRTREQRSLGGNLTAPSQCALDAGRAVFRAGRPDRPLDSERVYCLDFE